MLTKGVVTEEVSALRSLTAYLWAWGAVTVYREAGGEGYPSLSHLHGQVYRRVGAMGLSNMAALFTDVERWLRQEPPLMRGLLYFQYGRPQLTASHDRSVRSYVETVFGDLSHSDGAHVARVIARVRARWLRKVLPHLVSLEK